MSENVSNKIIIEPYNANWKSEYTRIKQMLEGLIGDIIVGIVHVGSTSVEGLAAKPIIDINVLMESYATFPKIREGLEKADFIHEGDLGIKGREVFKRKYKDEFMAYHLYVCPKDGEEHLRQVIFRDYLRNNEWARNEYTKLKKQLAEKFAYDREAYTFGKSEFVKQILEMVADNSYSDIK